MIKGARFSECGKYRYVLYRLWDGSKPNAMCIGLNPSTANADTDDPTIANLMRILENLGYGGFYMLNLFALVSPHPEDLRACPDPVKDNDAWIVKTQSQCKDVVFCWGNFPMAQYRAKLIKRLFPFAKCFGRNKNGSPKHPLYLSSTTTLISYNDEIHNSHFSRRSEAGCKDTHRA